MKIAMLIVASLLIICGLLKYLYSRQYKKEFASLYQAYIEHGHFIPPHVVIADHFGSLGTSIKAQWFRWILKNKKIKITQGNYLPKKSYDFLQYAASEKLKSWLINDGRFLLLEGILFIVALVLAVLVEKSS